MATEAQDIMSMYQPRMYDDLWWVDIGDGLRRFKTAGEARKFIAGKRQSPRPLSLLRMPTNGQEHELWGGFPVL